MNALVNCDVSWMRFQVPSGVFVFLGGFGRAARGCDTKIFCLGDGQTYPLALLCSVELQATTDVLFCNNLLDLPYLKEHPNIVRLYGQRRILNPLSLNDAMKL